MSESQENDAGKQDKKEISAELLQKVHSSANYCYNCNRCVSVCPLNQVGLFAPRDLISDINLLPLEEAIKKNNIWACLTCGQCTTYCPMTKEEVGVKIPELVLELRMAGLVDETELEKIIQCETHDGIITLISELMVKNPEPPNKLDYLIGTNLKTSESGEIAYFVGCLPILEDAISNVEMKYTDSAKAIIHLLNEAHITPVVLNEKCCGHDILWGKGDIDSFKKLAEFNVKLYKDAGVKTIITGCAEGYRTWKIDYPKVIEDFDFEVLYFAEYLLKDNFLETLRVPQASEMKVTYHDSCRLGRLGGKLYDAPRELLKQLPGVKLVEMENIKDDANCCGVTAFSGCNEYTRLIRKKRIEEATATGAEYLIVSCPKCLTHFNCFLSEPSMDNSEQNDIKVIDLATFTGKLLFLF